MVNSKVEIIIENTHACGWVAWMQCFANFVPKTKRFKANRNFYKKIPSQIPQAESQITKMGNVLEYCIKLHTQTKL
jgi:hypothetical protein